MNKYQGLSCFTVLKKGAVTKSHGVRYIKLEYT